MAVNMIVLKCLLLAAVPACQFASAAAHSRQQLEILGNRTAYVYSPKAGPSKAAVFVLHGSLVDAASMFDLGFERLADMHGFHVVYPEMAVPKSLQWGYRDDLSYFSALAKRLREPDFGVPADKLFICGHSSGGTMTLFVQNEMNEFSAAGVVEAAVGQLERWDMSRRGHRTIVVFNHADPVLKRYAPNHDQTAYLDLTIKTLRRSDTTPKPNHIQPLATGKTVTKAERLTFEKTDKVPELRVISWSSQPGLHNWALPAWTQTLDATEQLMNFFLFDNEEYNDVTHQTPQKAPFQPSDVKMGGKALVLVCLWCLLVWCAQKVFNKSIGEVEESSRGSLQQKLLAADAEAGVHKSDLYTGAGINALQNADMGKFLCVEHSDTESTRSSEDAVENRHRIDTESSEGTTHEEV